MNKKLITALLAGFIGIISLLWWLFLQYKILVFIEASELIWFIYILYIPITLLATVLLHIVNSYKEEEYKE